MQTFIAEHLKDSTEGREVNRILRSCVHCGFCIATCPTYRLLGDELDGPRGRIYLIKGMFEGQPVSRLTQQHLDRCLTCRACETTCPSGVEYGHLLDIGRAQLEQEVSRRLPDRLRRYLLRQVLPKRRRFGFLLWLGQNLRPLLPAAMKNRIPPKQPLFDYANTGAGHQHARRVLLARGCVQSALSPATNRAARQLLDSLGISAVESREEGCCGALDFHLGATAAARRYMRRNIDAWWPYVDQGIEAIISTASGCGVLLKDYAYLLQDDADYADKAKVISGLVRDISEVFSAADVALLKQRLQRHYQRPVFQSPCTLQHGQKLAGKTETLLQQLGFELAPVTDAHLCCGSAGVYSLLQPRLSGQLQEQKVENLLAPGPDVILTANIGCQMHLQQATDVPVKHWIEALAAACSQQRQPDSPVAQAS